MNRRLILRKRVRGTIQKTDWEGIICTIVVRKLLNSNKRGKWKGRMNEMKIIDIIKSRRTIKKFKTDPIDREMIKSWLEAAAMAPNHKMTEPWEIILIGPETRERVNHKTNFGNAPVVFAVVSKQGKTDVEREENLAATSCFIQNFMLAAWAEGVGTFWSSVGITPKNREILQVSEDYDVVGVLAIGYPEEIPEVKPRTAIENKIKELS